MGYKSVGSMAGDIYKHVGFGMGWTSALNTDRHTWTKTLFRA